VGARRASTKGTAKGRCDERSLAERMPRPGDEAFWNGERQAGERGAQGSETGRKVEDQSAYRPGDGPFENGVERHAPDEHADDDIGNRANEAEDCGAMQRRSPSAWYLPGGEHPERARTSEDDDGVKDDRQVDRLVGPTAVSMVNDCCRPFALSAKLTVDCWTSPVSV
jgi:hypothetical protein